MEFLLKISKIAKAFDNIGKSNGTAPVESRDNRISTAYEFFVADKLRSLANARYDAAKKAALEEGVLGDRATFMPGTNVETYQNEHFTITAKTANPASRLDATLLKNELTKALGEQKTAAIISEAVKESAAAVSYGVVAR